MNVRILSTVIGVLLTSSILTMTAVGQSTDDQKAGMHKRHAACEHMTGKKQIDCEKRMTEMDKKNQADSSSIPTSEDKKPPKYTPPQKP